MILNKIHLPNAYSQFHLLYIFITDIVKTGNSFSTIWLKLLPSAGNKSPLYYSYNSYLQLCGLLTGKRNEKNLISPARAKKNMPLYPKGRSKHHAKPCI